MEIGATTGEDLLACEQTAVPERKRYKSSDRSALARQSRAYKPDEPRFEPRYYHKKKLPFRELSQLGRTMGLEPTTTGTTNRGSAN